VATITGQGHSSLLPPADTPGPAQRIHPRPAGYPRAPEAADAAAEAWRSLASVLAGTPHVRTSRDGGRRYPARYARPLPPEPPGQPAVIPVYDPGSATGRMLALDLDPSRAVDVDDGAVQHRHERAALEVARQGEMIAALVAGLGGLVLTDVAPSGGRHVHVLFAAPLPWRELRDLCRAVSLRFGAVDPAPMANLGGQISPPGSRHKSGGWRLLAMPLEDAVAAAACPNGPEVWNGLLAEFAGELQALEADRDQAGDALAAAELDDAGLPWIPRRGGRAPLGGALDRVARTGTWDRSRYAGRSEARMAVLAAAAGRGWRLADVREAISFGTWGGLPGLYDRASEPGRMERLLPLEWRKATALAAGSENVRSWLTSDNNHPPTADPGADEFGFIRRWVTGTACAAGDLERVRGWGRRAIAMRQLLAAIGQAAMVSGSVVLEFGTRNLALHAGLSQRTVSRLLRILYEEADPLLDLVSRGKMTRADRFGLRIPDRYGDSVRWRRRRAGRIDGVHAAFLVLGGAAFLIHQVLDSSPARGAEVARAARLSPAAASAALRTLAEHGLAERGRDGWRRGPASLHRERAERYRQDRVGWGTRLLQYQGARAAVVSPGDGWLSLDDEQEWEAMLSGRQPVLQDDDVRGPPQLAWANA
jgi:DNA-binding transcriptional ArsR family regulator